VITTTSKFPIWNMDSICETLLFCLLSSPSFALMFIFANIWRDVYFQSPLKLLPLKILLPLSILCFISDVLILFVQLIHTIIYFAQNKIKIIPMQ
jgi:hypothetical protein